MPGARARASFRTANYQTEVFRRLEAKDPSIEHLGNWHTHHVNEYPTLSAGDVATYRRIVNHDLHNLDFFYALAGDEQETKDGTGWSDIRFGTTCCFEAKTACHVRSDRQMYG